MQRKIYITADESGSNVGRIRLRKVDLKGFCE